jgi:hypothetical protein
VASFKAGSGARNKKGPGGRRKPLKRLNSAKEIKGFPRLKFGWALLGEARIWLGLDLAWKKLGFLLAAPAFPVLAHGRLSRWLRRRDALWVLISESWYKAVRARFRAFNLRSITSAPSPQSSP